MSKSCNSISTDWGNSFNRGHGDQARDRARDHAQQRGLALGRPFDEQPAERAAEVATKVLTKASAVVPFDSRFEPALKPNQPTHSSEAPMIDMVTECGASSISRG